MSLLAKYQANVKESQAVTEVITAKVNNIIYCKDDRRIGVNTDMGTFFFFKDVSNITNVAGLPSKFKIELTLMEKGEHINVVSAKVDYDSISDRSLVVSTNLTVQLSTIKK